MEGTGACGAGLARFLQRAGVEVIEVDRPNRQERRRNGKSDQLDAVVVDDALTDLIIASQEERPSSRSVRLMDFGRWVALVLRRLTEAVCTANVMP